ncbi:MAG: hypothetical protein RLZZ347_481 [Candidatus Parcubacteria bacterium]|jgi:peptidoglycan hydrolase-like protein with peptidoglycan-binding domain
MSFTITNKIGTYLNQRSVQSALLLSLVLGLLSPVVSFAESPATVDLRTAGGFTILAKTGISTTGSTSVVGNIGVSPVPGSYVTGFSLILPVSSPFSTSALVTGKVYAADYTSPTPTNLTTAIGDMQTAYADASGRLNPTATELGAGNIGGLTITPGLYKWGTGVMIPADVTLSGGANDIWIFQIAQTLTVSSAVKINLSGGAQAGNIFWVVAGQTTIGTGAVFNGNILDQTAIVLNTGAKLNGHALAQTAVTLDSNEVTAPILITAVAVPVVAPVLKPVATVISPNGGETWMLGNQKIVQLSVSGAPGGAYLVASLADGPTPIDMRGLLNPNGTITFDYILSGSGCHGDSCYQMKLGSYKVMASLFDKQPCNLRAGCTPETLLASDMSDSFITVSVAPTSTPRIIAPTTPTPDTVVSSSQPSSKPLSCPIGKTLLCGPGMLREDGTDTTVCTCVDGTRVSSPKIPFGQQVRLFAHNLGNGSVDDDVLVLKDFLIAQHKGHASEALARGKGTTYFGPVTKAALSEFQASVGIPATGNCGILTRAYINARE